MTISEPENLLRRLFACAVKTADPMLTLPNALPEKPKGRVVVIGAGKASARMAEAVETVWGPCEGLVITRYGYARPTEGIEIIEAAHPIPDIQGAQATRRIMELLQSLTATDYVLALISGGGSALLTYPAGKISAKEKELLNAALLASGAPIGQMNIVRKHLSCVKGGQLAAMAYPARMLSLIISDVPGDNPADIASGPTVGDKSLAARALDILQAYRIEVPTSVKSVLEGKSGVIRPNDPRLSNVENQIIAAPSQSLAAAAAVARKLGLEVRILGDALEGEACDLGQKQAQLALSIQQGLKPSDAPILLLSGGECTVTRRGNGIGGPNAEFILSAAITLAGAAGIYGIACDTDGVDGTAEIAGGFISHSTLARAAMLGLNAKEYLQRNDSHRFFKAINDQIITGPTLTNVNDFRALLIDPPNRS